jgi:hypothetical protein
MLSQYFFEHYNSWNIKVNNIAGNKLNDVFDKYMTLFVIFNNLYNEIPAALVAIGIVVSKQLYDNKKATEYVVKYLGANELLNNLQVNKCDPDIHIIIDIIQNEEFHIKLNYDQYDRNDDLKILHNLKSKNDTNKAIAILQVCYYVRCNIFHGKKDFNEDQRKLVAAVTNILRPIVEQLYNKLII